jgi:hypothetical protein
MINGALYKNDKVVLRYYQPIPKLVKANGKEYVCDVKHSVSLLFVEESEVHALLAVKGGCCGGQRLVFSLCSPLAYQVWETGKY